MPATPEFKKWFLGKQSEQDRTAFNSLPKQKQEEEFNYFWSQAKKTYASDLKSGKSSVAPKYEPGFLEGLALGKPGQVVEKVVNKVSQVGSDIQRGQATRQAEQGLPRTMWNQAVQIATGGLAPSAKFKHENAINKLTEQGKLVYVKKMPDGGFGVYSPKGGFIGKSSKKNLKEGLTYYDRTTGKAVSLKDAEEYQRIVNTTKITENIATTLPSLAVSPLLAPGKTIGKRIVQTGIVGAGQGAAGGALQARQDEKPIIRGALEGAGYGAAAGVVLGGLGEIASAIKAFRAGKVEKQAINSRIEKLVSDLEDPAVPLAIKEAAAQKLTAVPSSQIEEFTDKTRLATAIKRFKDVDAKTLIAQKEGTGRVIGRQASLEALQQQKAGAVKESMEKQARESAILQKQKEIDDITGQLTKLEGSPYQNDDIYWQKVDLNTKRQVLQSELDTLVGKPAPPPIQAQPKKGVVRGGRMPTPGAVIPPSAPPAGGGMVQGGRVQAIPEQAPPAPRIEAQGQARDPNIAQTYYTAGTDSDLVSDRVRQHFQELIDAKDQSVFKVVVPDAERQAAAAKRLSGFGLNFVDDADAGDKITDQLIKDIDERIAQKGGSTPEMTAEIVAVTSALTKHINNKAIPQEVRDRLTRQQIRLIHKSREILSGAGSSLRMGLLWSNASPEAILGQATDIIEKGLGKGGMVVGKKSMNKKAMMLLPIGLSAGGGTAKAAELEEEAKAIESTDPEGAQRLRMQAGAVLMGSYALALAGALAYRPKVGGPGGEAAAGLLDDASRILTEEGKRSVDRFGRGLKTTVSNEGAQEILRLAQQLKDGDPSALSKMRLVINREVPANFWQKLAGSRYMAMLSKPGTWLKQPLSSATIYGLDTAESGMAGGLDVLMGKVTGQRAKVVPRLSQMGQEMRGMVRGGKAGVARSIRGEENPFTLDAFDPMTASGGYGAFGHVGGGNRVFQGIPGADVVERVAKAAFVIPDDATKGMAMVRSLLNDLQAQAKTRGIKWTPPKDFTKQIWDGENLSFGKLADYLDGTGLELTEPMVESSLNLAKRWTFQDENMVMEKANQLAGIFEWIGFGTQGARMQPNAPKPQDWEWTDSIRAKKDFNLGQIIMPFRGVPSAILQRTAERVGTIPYLLSEVVGAMNDLKNPKLVGQLSQGRIKLTPQRQKRIVELMATIPTTLGAMGLTALAYDYGLIHAGTGDWKQRTAEENEGLAPNSVNVSGIFRLMGGFINGLRGDELKAEAQRKKGDFFATVENIDPLTSLVVGTATAMRESREKGTDPMESVLMNTVAAIEDRSTVSGMQKIFKAESPIGGLLQSIAEIPASFIPSTFKAGGAALDEGQKRQRGIDRQGVGPIEAIGKETVAQLAQGSPFLRESLAKSVDIFGRDETYSQPGNLFAAIALGLAAPFKYGIYKATPEGEVQMKILEQTGETATPVDYEKQMKNGIIKVGEKKYYISPEQIQEFQRQMGEIARNEWARQAPNLEYGADPETIKKRLDNAITERIKHEKKNFIILNELKEVQK